ncbi:MAG: acetoacetate decarboxylase family protein [Dehalococcoidia bacterium]|nr:acetoacetate decarboxylase family protein [Dehalococcoidia bacterium]
MPLTGTLDITPFEADTPVVEDLGTPSLTFEGASILQVLYELDDADHAAMTTLLPPALHPTIPPTLYINAWHVPESDFGPFTLAEARVGCRAATRPRGFLARAFCDSEQAAGELAKRWGYPVQAADVRLRKTHFSADLTVQSAGRPILEAGMISPEAISGGDVQYIANLNLARVQRDGQPQTRLVQVDAEFTFGAAERGQPYLHAFDAAAWRLEGAVPVHPVSSSRADADIQMPTIRFLVNPALPPLESIERIDR